MVVSVAWFYIDSAGLKLTRSRETGQVGERREADDRIADGWLSPVVAQGKGFATAQEATCW